MSLCVALITSGRYKILYGYQGIFAPSFSQLEMGSNSTGGCDIILKVNDFQ